MKFKIYKNYQKYIDKKLFKQNKMYIINYIDWLKISLIRQNKKIDWKEKIIGRWNEINVRYETCSFS